jgi:hypothetical protein
MQTKVEGRRPIIKRRTTLRRQNNFDGGRGRSQSKQTINSGLKVGQRENARATKRHHIGPNMPMPESTKTLTGGRTGDTAKISTTQPRAEIKLEAQRGRRVGIEGNNKGLQVGEGLGTDVKIRDRQSEVKHIGGTRI